MDATKKGRKSIITIPMNFKSTITITTNKAGPCVDREWYHELSSSHFGGSRGRRQRVVSGKQEKTHPDTIDTREGANLQALKNRTH
jgi:hypothetical protein